VRVQLRDKLVADGEGFNVPEANTKQPFWRGGGGPPESSGPGMQEEIRRRAWEAPLTPAGGTQGRKVNRYGGAQGETRRQG
jgi:hypothetical protein